MHQSTSSRSRRLAAGTGSIALSLTLGAGLLVATPASAAVPGRTLPSATVVTAAAVATVKPKLTNSASKSKLAWGTKVTITAKLRDPGTGKAVKDGSVKLQAYRSGKWKTWATTKVSSSGTATLKATPLSSVSLRTYYTGAGTYQAATGKTLKIKVVASGKKILTEAKKHKGALYKYGAAGPKRFDCSGFTMYVYKKAAGRKLPHKANSQQRYGTKIAKNKKKPGDLIIVRSGSYGYHASIYAGNGYIWDSPRSGARVSKRKLWTSSYVVRRLAAV